FAKARFGDYTAFSKLQNPLVCNSRKSAQKV
ncbi:MAG: hypothetical protein ACJATS_000297, partial [Psychroserpens sp.]